MDFIKAFVIKWQRQLRDVVQYVWMTQRIVIKRDKIGPFLEAIDPNQSLTAIPAAKQQFTTRVHLWLGRQIMLNPLPFQVRLAGFPEGSVPTNPRNGPNKSGGAAT